MESARRQWEVLARPKRPGTAGSSALPKTIIMGTFGDAIASANQGGMRENEDYIISGIALSRQESEPKLDPMKNRTVVR
jgi:hypothetical protein